VTLYNAYIAGINQNFETDIDFSGASIPDILQMEMPKVTGFEIEIPVQVLPIPFATTDNEWALIQSVTPTTTSFYIDSTTGIMVDDYLWVGIEVVKVTSIGAGVIDVDRAQRDTLASGYTKTPDTTFYLYKYPKTLVGLIVELSEIQSGNLLSVGVITKDPEVVGLIAKIECDDLLTTLETEIVYRKQDQVSNLEDIVFATQTGTPPRFANGNCVTKLKKYCDDSWIYIQRKVQNIEFLTSNPPFKDFKEALTAVQRFTSHIIVFDPTIGKYKFMQLTESTSLQTKLEISLLDFADIEASAKATRLPLISSVKIVRAKNKALPNETAESVWVLPYASGLGGGQLVYDFSGYFFQESVAQEIALFFLRQYSIFYAKLEIPSHPILARELQPGQFIQATDIEEFYTFQDISDVALYIGMDNGVMIFYIASTSLKYPVSPALPMSVSGTSTIATFYTNSNLYKISDYIDYTDRLLCNLAGGSIEYYVAGEYLVFVHSSSGAMHERQIQNIVYLDDETLAITLTSTLIDGEYWAYYPKFSEPNTSAKQKLFAYFSRNQY